MEAQNGDGWTLVVGKKAKKGERKNPINDVNVFFKERGNSKFADILDDGDFEDEDFFARLDERLKQCNLTKLDIQEFQNDKFAVSFDDEIPLGVVDKSFFAHLHDSLIIHNVMRLEIQTSVVSEGLRHFFVSVPAAEIVVCESEKWFSLVDGDFRSMLSGRRTNGEGKRQVKIARPLRLAYNIHSLFTIFTAFHRHKVIEHPLAVSYLTMHIDRSLRVPLLKMMGVIQAGNAIFTKDRSVSLWLEQRDTTFVTVTSPGRKKVHNASLLWIGIDGMVVRLPKEDDHTRDTFYVDFQTNCYISSSLIHVKATVAPSKDYDWC
ncbi:hypothetical protein PFISCL1PPCAC_21613 [Pristionchus fissidentatus]|uniref:Uncharacterized protein n=1 Tax=Pristionchus fissidentatus TaxID=1538716 RepID=A0AAV5WDG6_9BILA|nr:hypothetical protein PFISCL1PPCAC_21613 [Pristionchus fissidentatus]